MPSNQRAPLESLYKAARGRGVEFSEEFVPTTRTFDTSELRLSYTEWGDRGLPAVVLLHGFAQTSHAWDLITLGLADRFHLISLDQRGHGDSEWATDGDYSLETQQNDRDEFIKSLGVSGINLVGLSMGGRNAYVFASRNPHLISNLVVVDTGPNGMRSGRSRIRNFVTMPDELDTFEEFVERVHFYVPQRSLDQIRNSLLNNIRQMKNGKWTWKYDRLLRDPNYRRQAASQDQLWAYWESVKCPSLIIRGGNSDVLTSETVAEMTSRNPFSESAVVLDSGHLVPGDNPAGFLRVIRPWLLERV